MPTSLAECARYFSQHGLRYHVDKEQGVIRLVFVTRLYRNLRDEALVVVGVEAPDGGRRVRARVSRAFAPGDDPAATCLAACRLAAETPLVGVEFDADGADLRLVVEADVDDRALEPLELVALVDRLVEAAEAWTPALGAAAGRPRRSSTGKRGAA
ncbi:MAG: hypothetical protein EBZ74_03230 [Planctomycetia bacterium]|nr:hypothetical protein [Planctomycetia bacterium]